MNTLVVLEMIHLFSNRNISGLSLTWALMRGTRVIWLSLGLVVAVFFAIIEVKKHLRLSPKARNPV